MTEREAIEALQAENARLVALLESHGIAWRAPSAAASRPRISPPCPCPRRRQRPRAQPVHCRESGAVSAAVPGRTDVYPVRWEGKTSGKSGYAPACANEWRAGVCEKPRIKCGDCGHRLLVPLSDAVIYDHLAGKQTVGVYPLLEDDTCHFLAVDFDEADWQQDAQAFMQSCNELGRAGGAGDFALGPGRACLGVLRRASVGARCPAPGYRHHQPYLRAHPAAQAGVLRPLVSQPGHDAQGRIRQPDRAAAAEAPARKRLQRVRRRRAAAAPRPVGLLASIQPMAPHDIEPTILRATGGVHPLDVTFIDDEDLATPWKRQASRVNEAGRAPCPTH
jgi:hypothetical protein